GRRWESARSFAVPLRQRHEQRQSTYPYEPADPDSRRRSRQGERQPPHPCEGHDAAFEPDDDLSGRRRYLDREVWRKHREDQSVMRPSRVFAICALAAFTAAAALGAAGDVRLVTAAKQHDMAAARSLLKQRVDVNTPDVDGMTPLHWAAHWDELELAKQLLAAGANAKATNRYGVTPLHEATLVADVALMEALLKAGANPE